MQDGSGHRYLTLRVRIGLDLTEAAPSKDDVYSIEQAIAVALRGVGNRVEMIQIASTMLQAGPTVTPEPRRHGQNAVLNRCRCSSLQSRVDLTVEPERRWRRLTLRLQEAVELGECLAVLGSVGVLFGYDDVCEIGDDYPGSTELHSYATLEQFVEHDGSAVGVGDSDHHDGYAGCWRLAQLLGNLRQPERGHDPLYDSGGNGDRRQRRE